MEILTRARKPIRRMVAKNTPISDMEWELMNIAVGAFIRKFPIQWITFQQEMSQEKAELHDKKYGTADKIIHKGLSNMNHRKIGIIPTFTNPENGNEESLIMVLEKINPYIFSTKKNSREFFKRFPVFRLVDKI